MSPQSDLDDNSEDMARDGYEDWSYEAMGRGRRGKRLHH